MNRAETLEEFYRTKLNWMPECLQKEIGHFNVFNMEEFARQPVKLTSFTRKEYFKISLMHGKGHLQYADKDVHLDGKALFFANSMVPYSWDMKGNPPTGYFCIFSEGFFTQYGNFRDYPVFRPGAHPCYLLDDQQAEEMAAVFRQMQQEMASDYAYKYDVIRNRVFDLVHFAMKLQPAVPTIYQGSNANTRVSTLFTELLERQFPIETRRQQIRFRSPAEFSDQLSLHVNHLNRALKEVTGKTTSQLIGERVIQEARILLMHTDWNISEIAWCLGFEELPHFINFFKKNVRMTPKSFRAAIV